MITRNMNIYHHWFWGDSSQTPSGIVDFVTAGGKRQSEITGYSVSSSLTSMHNNSYVIYRLMDYLRNVTSFTDATTSALSAGVVLGSGNAPASFDDLTLSGEPISGFTSSKTLTQTYGEDYYECTAEYTVTNNNDFDITVGEIGLFITITSQSAQYNATYKYYPVLLERTALESPITIPAGGVGQITYTVRTNLPTA